MNSIPSTSSYSFSGRCVQIRDAQWVCHSISSNLPHISTTKMRVMYDDVDQQILKKDPASIKRMTVWRYNIINKLNDARENYQARWHESYNIFRKTVEQLQKAKLGNCAEDANVAAVILKMNGVKNACCAGVRSGYRQIDHEVCVFNTDNSEFKGTITGKTVIIDPWLGIADFASNVFLKYKNMYRKHLNISDKEPLRLGDIEQFELTSQDIADLRKEFPQFIFKSKTRSYMQNKKSAE